MRKLAFILVPLWVLACSREPAAPTPSFDVAPAAADPLDTASAEGVVLPNAYTDVMGEAWNTFPHANSNMRYQQVFLGSELGGLRFVSGLCLRRDELFGGPAGTQQLTVKLGPTRLDHTTLTPVFDANYSATPTTVFSGDVNIPASSGGGTPDDFYVCLEFTTLYLHPAGSNVIVEIVNTSSTRFSNFADACQGGAGCTTTRVWAVSATATAGNIDLRFHGLIMKFIRGADPTTKAGNPVVQSATGQGSLIQADERRTFAFSAVKHADGSVRGEFQLINRLSGVIIHGTVLCLTVVGTDAWLGGVIDHSNLDLSDETSFRVRDNGEGRQTEPDGISLMNVNQPSGFAAEYCASTPQYPPLNAIVAGNIQVRPVSEMAAFTGLWSGLRFNTGGVPCCTWTWNLTQTSTTVTGLLTAPHTGCAAIGGCPVTGTVSGTTMTFRVDLTFVGPDAFEQGTATVVGDRMTGTFEQCFFGSCVGGLTFDLIRQ
jgi:hypothetical protein